MADEIIAQSETIPACTGGWNARDNEDIMSPIDARVLVNAFPQVDNIKIRNGYSVHATGMGTSAVQTLCEYAAKNGTRQLIAAANGNIYNASTSGAAATSVGSGFTVDAWQVTNFKNFLFLVNGADRPQKYDGTTSVNAVYTGIADDKDLINVNVYKSRLYFVQKNSCSVWYGGVDAVTGALTEFNIDNVIRLGGFIQFAGSWTRDTGSGGLQDFFIIVTNMGELLIYGGGSYPGDLTWSLVGRFEIPIPLGRRAFAYYGQDMVIITELGVIPLSGILDGPDATGKYNHFTDKIQNAFREAVKLYKDNFGWEVIMYPRGNSAYINIPIASNTNYEQYVMNTLSGSWCRFTNIKAITWSLFNESIYFGGIDGKVYRADNTASDNNQYIPVDIQWAYNYLGGRDRLKRFLMARPLFQGDVAVSFAFDIDVDYRRTISTATVTVIGNPGSPWETSPWDTSPWEGSNIYIDNWYTICGLGRNVSLKLKGSFRDAPFSISAIQIAYEIGGIL